MSLSVLFDVKTQPNIDLILTQMRESLAPRSCPWTWPITRHRQENDELAAADAVAVLTRGTHDRNFLANYAYINMVDDLLRTPASATRCVCGRYAMRIW